MSALTDDEIARVRQLLKHADDLQQEVEYRLAKRLLIKRWRGFVIGIAGVIGAIYVIKDAVKGLIAGVLQ
jgi:hypothetical protein